MKEPHTEDSVRKLYGLIGKDISYSFSRTYFNEKFQHLRLNDCRYVNFDLPSIEDFDTIVAPNLDRIAGLNVTIPYKEKIMSFLDEIDPEAEKIGAVNTIKIYPDGRLKGYNTDVFGFENSLMQKLSPEHKSALVLGTGGASKAVAFVLEKLGISYRFVSRRESGTNVLTYKDLDKSVIDSYQVIVNSTPLGTFPNIETKPDLPYEYLGSSHLLFDLIYNPAKTAFLLEGEKRGAKILNGSKMLEMQADRAWVLWNS